MILEIIIFVLTSLITYYLYVYKKIHCFYNERGIKYLAGVPVFGNIYNSTFARKHLVEDFDKVYKAFPNEKYVGFIEGTKTLLLIKDPDLIKNITVKDFDHFHNRKDFLDKNVEPFFGKSVLLLNDGKWRDMRTLLSPAFTGSKMKMMIPFMIEISSNIIEYLKGQKIDEINVEDFIKLYMADVLASTMFGIPINSVKEPDNDFYKMTHRLINITNLERLTTFLAAEYPRLSKILNIKILNPKAIDFLRSIAINNINYRREANYFRPDMIQLLVGASKDTDWTDEDLAAQVFLFYSAGFEGGTSAISMCLHELALNPHVQEKLYKEIKIFKEINDSLKYENISELKYLDCVVNEASRKWSGAVLMDRVCTKPYVLPPPREGGNPYLMKPGDVIFTAPNSIHMDEKYYPNPEIFDPERFSDENKHKIKPFTFMPFGAGPRNCLGLRYAVFNIKIIIYNIVLNFKILKCKKTMDPIRIHSKNFNVKAKDGTWLKFEERN